MLRPINVPFHNKWLRDTASDLVKLDGIPASGFDIEWMMQKIGSELRISPRIHHWTDKVYRWIAKKLKETSDYGHLQAVGVYIAAFKMMYGLNDKDYHSDENIEKFRKL